MRARDLLPGRLPCSVVLAGIALACSDPQKVGPCVSGLEVGDVFGARVLEVYDETTTYEYDRSVYLGSGDVDPYFADCNPTRDLVFGETLVVDVVYLPTGDPWESGCTSYDLSVRDTEKMVPGPAVTGPGGPGAAGLGTAEHRFATVEGCTRWWLGDFMVRDGAGVFDQAAPGELPPVLLKRAMAATDSTCSYSEASNQCLFVVQLERM